MRPSTIIAAITLLLAANSATTIEDHVQRFELTIRVKRTDMRKTDPTVEPATLTSESEMTLFGRVERPHAGSRVTFYADSIRYESRKPSAFQTFMSADTMYYRSAQGGGAVDHRKAEYDSMLSCVFKGAALQVALDETGAPQTTKHLNDRCQSGEYERINAPVTLCAFLIPTPAGRDRWREMRPSPSFSGVGFHPEIEWLYRTAQTTDWDATVTVAADSTIENLTTHMKNGEEVMIVRDRIRIAGTIVIDRSSGLPKQAELRVGESLQLVRPHASGMVITKEGLYTIRLTLTLP